MKRITINLKELMEKLQQMSQEDMHFVELAIVPEQKEQNDEEFPAFLHLQGIRKTSADYIVDYESIDEISSADLAS